MTACAIAFRYCDFGVACNTAGGGVSALIVVVGVVAFESQVIERFCNDSIVFDSVDSVDG